MNIKAVAEHEKRVSFFSYYDYFFTYRWAHYCIPSCQPRETPLQSFAVACYRWVVSLSEIKETLFMK